MDTKSPKPPESGFDKFNAIKVLRDWLDREGGNQKAPQILDILAELTAAAWLTGQPAPAIDADKLRQWYFDRHGGIVSESAASRWLSSSEVRRWWEARTELLRQAYQQANLEYGPVLVLQTGGGRGNPTLYRLDIEPVPSQATSDPQGSAPLPSPELIRYQIEPAKAAWWLRWIGGTRSFHIRSWRGYLLIGLTAAGALFTIWLWWFLVWSYRAARPIQSGDLGMLLTITGLTWAWWLFARPIVRLPLDRVSVAGDVHLAWSQLHGQLRLMRDSARSPRGSSFQLVRHWATCPICAGEVEIASGGKTFPGRLVGRCSDSPLEHVYSFDPVTLSGRPLLWAPMPS